MINNFENSDRFSMYLTNTLMTKARLYYQQSLDFNNDYENRKVFSTMYHTMLMALEDAIISRDAYFLYFGVK